MEYCARTAYVKQNCPQRDRSQGAPPDKSIASPTRSGAHAVQMVSALLRHGPEHLAVLRRELVQWLEEHEYGSLREMRGSWKGAIDRIG